MSKQTNETELSASDKIANFLANNKRIIALSLLVLALGLVVYFVTMYVTNKNAEENFTLLASYHQEYLDSKDNEEQSFDKVAFLKKLEDFSNSTSGFVSAKSDQILADIAFEDKDFETACKFYLSASQKAKDTYLEPLMTFSLAVSYEEQGNQDKAIESYLLASKVQDFAYVARAVFSVARIEESRGNADSAISYYNEVIENYPYTNWSSLAQSRLVSLDIEKNSK